MRVNGAAICCRDPFVFLYQGEWVAELFTLGNRKVPWKKKVGLKVFVAQKP